MLIPGTAEQFMRLQDDAKAERQRRKEIERNDDGRILDSWERYRTLNDHCGNLLDLTELYDRKTRFALLILGGLNALNLLLLTRADLLASLQGGSAVAFTYACCYALLSLAILLHAVSALKPRPEHLPPADDVPPSQLLHSADESTVDGYCARWRRARIGDVNQELAVMAFMRARANELKLRALRRVYLGLYVLVGLTALCFGVAGLQ